MGKTALRMLEELPPKIQTLKMQYFLLIGVIVLAVESKAEENGTSATVAAATTEAIATTGAPSSYGASIFAMLIKEFDVLKEKDKSLSAKVATLTSKDSSLTARIEKLEKFDERTKGWNKL